MTIGGWITFAIIAFAIIGIGIMLGVPADDLHGGVIGGLIGAIISALICAVMLWYYGNTEGGKRAFESQDSNLHGGIERTVTVYDIEGEQIAQYEGKFDIECKNDRLIFDDENGKRHIIYYKTATVVIDEK